MKQISRRRWLRMVSALALTMPGGISGLIRGALAAGNAPVKPGINTLKGEVKVNGEPGRIGLLLKRGDTIATGPGAEVTYVIGADAFLQRGDSIVEFGTEATKQFMRVITGRILSVFAKEGPRTIVVSTATLGIRGTACYIEDGADIDNSKVDAPARSLPAGGQGLPAVAGGTATNQRRTYFCLCYGEVEVVPNAAPEQRAIYATRYHDHPIYINEDPVMPSMMDDAKVINHTDTELILLESLVGRRPPFFGRESSYL